MTRRILPKCYPSGKPIRASTRRKFYKYLKDVKANNRLNHYRKRVKIKG